MVSTCYDLATDIPRILRVANPIRDLLHADQEGEMIFVREFDTWCGKPFRARLTQEDVDDGCQDGTLVCQDCLEESIDLGKLYIFLGKKPN